MLSDVDIKKIIKANREVFVTKKDLANFATKEDLAKFATKDDLENLRKDTKEGFANLKNIFATKEELLALEERLTKSFSDLQSAVDKFAKKADTYFQEMLVLAHKVERHEKWLHQIAEKLGVKLEY